METDEVTNSPGSTIALSVAAKSLLRAVCPILFPGQQRVVLETVIADDTQGRDEFERQRAMRMTTR